MTKNRKEIVVFFGPPGSGKGSLSALCVKRLGWKQLSTGNLCREHIAQQTAIGKDIDFAIKSGKLISDSLIIDMAYTWLKETFEIAGTVIFDGFPRTVPQAKALHEMIATLKDVAFTIIRLDVPYDAVVYRLLARSICQNNKCQSVYSMHKHSSQLPIKHMTCNECESPLVRRSDDEESAIKERLQLYQKHEKSMIDFYESVQQSMHVLSADMPLEDVYAQLLEQVGTKGI